MLTVLDRTHDPLRVPDVVDWARRAGFEQVSLDLIYGTPGESLADWATSLDAALACAARPRVGVLAHRRGRHRPGPPGAPRRGADDRRRRPRRQVRRWPTSGSSAAGLGWYEVSNWARDDEASRAGTTWATGPAATGGASAPARTPTSAGSAGGTSSTRRRTPTGSPRAAARPTPVRCSTRRPGGSSGCCSRCGCATACRSTCSTSTAERPCGRSWSTTWPLVEDDRLVLTRPGRLLADAVVRDLLG